MLLRPQGNRLLLLCLFLPSSCLAQIGSSATQPPDPITIVRTALEKFQARSTEARNYVFREHETIQRSTQNGKLTFSNTYQIMFIEGKPYRLHIEQNNRPIPEEDVEKEKKRLEESARKHLEENQAIQQKQSPGGNVYGVAWAKPQVPEIPLQNLPESHKLQLVRTEPVDGVDAYVIEAKPVSDHDASKNDSPSSRDFKMKV